MYSKLAEKLEFALEPVAVYFTDKKPENALRFKEGVRGCVMSMLVAAGKGKCAAFDEKTYGCPGGGAGLCFGDTYEKNNFPIECLLSTGDEALAALGRTSKMSFGIGERFFATPELAGRFRSSFPFTETPEKYVVFMPLSQADENDPPELVYIFANPDQLSALVTMLGFYSGDNQTAISPFCAACQSIAMAYQEIKKENPKAVLGLFDISQRNRVPKELLSITMPYSLYLSMDGSVDKSCLTTESWENIAGRFRD